MHAKFGHVTSFVDFDVSSFLHSKPGHGAQRQVSVNDGLLMCDVLVLGVHISRYVSLYDHKV
jgi:hypothetical protein